MKQPHLLRIRMPKESEPRSFGCASKRELYEPALRITQRRYEPAWLAALRYLSTSPKNPAPYIRRPSPRGSALGTPARNFDRP